MTNEEDKQFSQQNASSSSMSGLDKSLAQQESGKRARINQAIAQRDKYMETAQLADRIASSIVDQSSSRATSSSESDDNYQPPSTPATLCQFQPKKSKRSILTTEEDRTTQTGPDVNNAVSYVTVVPSAVSVFSLD